MPRSATAALSSPGASLGQDNSGWGVYGQRYGAAGGARRRRVQGQYPCGARSGQFVRCRARRWRLCRHLELDRPGWLRRGVYGQRYSAAGAPAGDEFLVNTVKTGNQDFPSVAGLSDGGFIVTFQSNNSGGGIYGQRLSTASKITLDPVKSDGRERTDCHLHRRRQRHASTDCAMAAHARTAGRALQTSLARQQKPLASPRRTRQNGNQYRAVFSNSLGTAITNSRDLDGDLYGERHTLDLTLPSSTFANSP